MQRYSKLFGKTVKSAKEYDSINATLLQKGGFIEQVMSGAYIFLPLGLRVLEKIEQIIREEMNQLGSELLMTALSPKELWEQTGRLDTVDVLMQTGAANVVSKGRHEGSYILNPTHEDMVTPLAKAFVRSYKEFPFAVFQIQTKFRNEKRPKSGLLRGREFRMKDLYSFHTSEEDLKQYYEVVKEAYIRIFQKLGIGADTVVAQASGGDFTEDFSHEFQTKLAIGEDTLFEVKSNGQVFNKEVAPSRAVYPGGDEEELPMEEVYGEGIIGVEELCKLLNVPAWKTTKTLLYQTDTGEIIAVGIRGDYEVNEEKLRKVVGAKTIALASEDVVEKVTGAIVGYAGLLNLPKEVRIICDDSIQGRKNMEMGANKSNVHMINVNFGRDLPLPEAFYDVKMVQEGDCYPETGEPYEVYQGCEVGNIFPLNTKFSKACGYTFMDEQGKEQIVYMGCYGIGPSRVMGVIVEKFNDSKGIIWPKNIAPYDVHLITIGDQHDEKALELIVQLEAKGCDVLWDDRAEARPGEKFADADLIGIPLRVVLSDRSLEQGGYEVKGRTDEKAEIKSLDDLLQLL